MTASQQLLKLMMRSTANGARSVLSGVCAARCWAEIFRRADPFAARRPSGEREGVALMEGGGETRAGNTHHRGEVLDERRAAEKN